MQNPLETLVGAGVIAVAVGFGVYAAQVNEFTGGAGDGYEVAALFRAANGLASGTDVRIAGVKVGVVSEVTLDPDTYRAKALFAIDEGVEIPEDSLVRIDSEGLLGGTFVALEPGASFIMLENGDEITFTQGSYSLFDLLIRFAGGGGGETPAPEAAPPASPEPQQ